ncbi:MAG TPA: T9SS type A sorting domain-containing protein [Chitinophagaceae bacterium]|nr:T9SS type A sorting domain-containing protein [Chitinophagaceae bacterium]
MNYFLQRTIHLFFLFSIAFLSQAQVTNTYTTSATWTVPAAVSSIAIKVYGGAGGTGGQDCGAGCSNAAAGPAGYVLASYNVTPGDVIGIYPGGKGVNGSNSVTATGGGSGGTDTYPSLNFNGGNGGNAGGSGSSGGGGGGGAASIITINSTIKIVAGGAGGGGGMANSAGSGLAGSSSTSSNGTNTGGNGTTPGGDGGGGGGGGGGQFASAGGGVYAVGGESAGNGGFLGVNSVSGASSITTNGNITWTNTGQIEITYTATLPVTWLSFTATKQSIGIALMWSTATEQNTKDYKIQHSINGINWNDIGIVPAAGNSNAVQQYSFIDQNPTNALNYYRLLQRDLDGNINYSKVVLLNFVGAERMLKIYPNPVVNGVMTVSLKQASIVWVYNSIGVKLMQKELPAGEHLFNLSLLSRGTYYMKVKDDAVLFVIQ